MKHTINRRHFIAAAGAAALASKATFALQSRTNPRLAFAASKQRLNVYAISNNTSWTPLQSLASEAPIALAIDHRTRTLHVLHAVDQYRNLPRGYIESFRINEAQGCLESLSHQPLSLSATGPRHIAISPNSKLLAVSISGGSAYNLLPIREDGTPAPPIAIRKETAPSASTRANPGPLTFNHRSDRILALAHGHRTLSVFDAQPALPLLSRITFPDNFNPTELTAHPSEDLLAVTSESGSVLSFRHDPATGALSVIPQTPLARLGRPLHVGLTNEAVFAWSAEAIAFL